MSDTPMAATATDVPVEAPAAAAMVSERQATEKT